MAGNVYYPAGYSEGGDYPAVVVVHPGGGVKEQTAGFMHASSPNAALWHWLLTLHQGPVVACRGFSMTR